jgi:hypothetical protein
LSTRHFEHTNLGEHPPQHLALLTWFQVVPDVSESKNIARRCARQGSSLTKCSRSRIPFLTPSLRSRHPSLSKRVLTGRFEHLRQTRFSLGKVAGQRPKIDRLRLPLDQLQVGCERLSDHQPLHQQGGN